MKLVFILIFLFLSGCRSFQNVKQKDNVNQEKTEQNRVIEVLQVSGYDLNPVTAVDSSSRKINSLLFSGLFKLSPDGSIVPDLVEEYEMQKNSINIRFVLKKGVLWHDGHELTSSDVAYTVSRVFQSGNVTPYRQFFSRKPRVVCLSPRMFYITHGRIFSPAVSAWTMGIIPEHIFSASGFCEDQFKNNPTGSGPFRFNSAVPGKRLILEAFERYFEGKPLIDEYIFSLVPDASEGFIELVSKRASIMELTPDQYCKQASDELFGKYFNLYKKTSPEICMMIFNLSRPGLNEKKLRKAICSAVDPGKLIEEVFHGHARRINGPFPAFSWASQYLSDEKNTDEESNLTDVKCLSLLCNAFDRNELHTAEYIRKALGKISLEVQIIAENPVTVLEMLRHGSFECALYEYCSQIDPDPFGLLHSTMIPAVFNNFTGANFSRFDNQSIDRLLESSRNSFDQEIRTRKYRELTEIMSEELPVHFLYNREKLYAAAGNIQGFTVSSWDLIEDIKTWYLTEPEEF